MTSLIVARITSVGDSAAATAGAMKRDVMTSNPATAWVSVTWVTRIGDVGWFTPIELAVEQSPDGRAVELLDAGQIRAQGKWLLPAPFDSE